MARSSLLLSRGKHGANLNLAVPHRRRAPHRAGHACRGRVRDSRRSAPCPCQDNARCSAVGYLDREAILHQDSRRPGPHRTPSPRREGNRRTAIRGQPATGTIELVAVLSVTSAVFRAPDFGVRLRFVQPRYIHRSALLSYKCATHQPNRLPRSIIKLTPAPAATMNDAGSSDFRGIWCCGEIRAGLTHQRGQHAPSRMPRRKAKRCRAYLHDNFQGSGAVRSGATAHLGRGTGVPCRASRGQRYLLHLSSQADGS